MTIQEREVVTVLHKIKPHKASGPDGLKGKVLKECAAQLGHVYKVVSNLPGQWFCTISLEEFHYHPGAENT